MKWKAKIGPILISIVAVIACAQSSTDDRGLTQETQVRGYWVDPSTGLMWAGKDNGRNANWHRAMDYCHKLRLAGYPDWRLASIDELEGIYEKNAEAPGRGGQGASTWQIKGNLFLTGMEWSSTLRTDDREHPDGFAWYFDFANGRRNDDDAGRFSGYYANDLMRALCVRRSEE